jgi:hypothetical protein
MTAALHAIARRGRGLALATADRAGTVVRTLPGAAGALMLAAGLGQMYQPLFLVTLGLFALALDRKLP